MTLYRPLSGDDLRLIRFKRSHLSLEVFPPEKIPAYIALSYVWGDANDTKEIYLNSQALQVTRNLYHALRQIADWGFGYQDQEPLFWIDAICINQADNDEKSKQVARMGEIYSNATSVVCWLGKNSDLDDRVAKMMFDRINAIGADERCSDMTWLKQYPLADELGTQYELFKLAFLSTIQNPWFSRIWIIQEAVLPRSNPMFALGRHTTSMSALL